MYETLDQKEPVFDAKGIETVRRDNCPAVAKVNTLNYLFFSKWFSKLFFLTNWFFFITLFYFRSDLGEIPSHFVRSKRCEFGEEVRAAAVSKVDGGSGVAAGFYFREGISRNEKLQTNGVRTCVVTRKVSSRSLLVKGERMADAVSAFPFTTEFQIKPGRTGVIRDLKQARTATAVNKQLNFTVKNKPHTTNSIYCIFEAYFMIKSVWKNCIDCFEVILE